MSVFDVIVSVLTSDSGVLVSTIDLLDCLVGAPVGADFLLEGDLLALRVLDLERPPLPLDVERVLDLLAGVFFPGDKNFLTSF